MKIILASTLCFCLVIVRAQDKSLLINSGDVIKEGLAYYEDSKYDKAINKYKLVSENDTNYSTALYEMGLAYASQKNYSSAIEVFKKGLVIQSVNKANFIQQLGNAYSSNNQLDKALETYRNGLKEFPYYFRFYYEMAAACYLDKKPKEALLYLDSCLKINFGYGRAHYLMGQVCQQNNYFVPALLSYQMASYLSYDDAVGLAALMAIENIANGEVSVNKDSIVTLFAKDENNFEDLEEIIRSKTELDSRYKVKPEVKLKYTALIKCLHLMNSRINQYSGNKGWYGETLVPIYTQWWNHKDFAIMMYRMCASTSASSEEALKMFTKNKSDILEQYGNFYNTVLAGKYTYESRLPGVKGIHKHQFLYNNDNLYAMIPENESYVYGKGFDPKNGRYIYFYNNGNLKQELNYVNGEEMGTSLHYYEEGGLSSKIVTQNKSEYSYTLYYSNGQPKYSGKIKDGVTADNRTSYYTNGVTDEIIPVNSDGKIEGKRYQYFDNGRLYNVIDYTNGKFKDGEIVSYYKNGAVQNKINYKNEKRDGPYTEYHQNGQMSVTGQYKAGSQEGNWKEYHENGKLAKDYNYKGGSLDGSYKSYYDNGTLQSESEYADGDNKGKTINYDFDGKLFAEYVESKGKIKNAAYYDKTGKLIYEADARKNELQLSQYNALGIKTEEGTVLKDFRTGTWKFYADNGALSSIKSYDSKGYGNGKCETYYVGGNIKSKYELKDNNYDGYYVSYYFNGTKSMEGYYVNDSREGTWREYFPNGIISEEMYYLNGTLTGVYKIFYPNGKLHYTEEYKDGRFHKYCYYDIEGNLVGSDTINLSSESSPLNVSYKNGNPEIAFVYSHGIKEGTQYRYWGNKVVKRVAEYRYGDCENMAYEYYPNGKLQNAARYKWDKIDSVFVEYFETTGTVEHTSTYQYGEENGPEKYYYDNGKVETQGENKYGKREGWYEYYAPDGHLQYKLLYHLGIELAYSYQDKTGQLVKEIPFVNATGDFNCTFSNGNPSVKGSFFNGERHGSYIKYYFNGKKASESTYSYGYQEGVHTEYYENGKIKSQVNYVGGYKDGVEKKYDDQGNLQMETTWSYSDKNGPEIIYNHGKVLKTIQYEYGNTYDK